MQARPHCLKSHVVVKLCQNFFRPQALGRIGQELEPLKVPIQQELFCWVAWDKMPWSFQRNQQQQWTVSTLQHVGGVATPCSAQVKCCFRASLVSSVQGMQIGLRRKAQAIWSLFSECCFSLFQWSRIQSYFQWLRTVHNNPSFWGVAPCCRPPLGSIFSVRGGCQDPNGSRPLCNALAAPCALWVTASTPAMGGSTHLTAVEMTTGSISWTRATS